VDNELEVIRDQMEEKRASLSDKLDALEDHVLETVHGATSVVSNAVRDVSETVDAVKENIHETVESVKENIQGTVDAVKETFNVSGKIRQHPWLAVGGAFAGGFVGALLLGSSSRKKGYSNPAPHTYGTNGTNGTNGAPAEPVQAPAKSPRTSDSTSGLTYQLGSAASEALKTLEGMAVGTLMGVLSQVVGDMLPTALKEEADKLFGELNAHLGGKSLYKLDLTPGQSNPTEPSKGDYNDDGNQAEMARTMGSAPRQGQESVGQSDRRRTDKGSGGLRTNDRAARGANGKEA
jgi:ElaB/YqjD/DUF883 family membrane-anchored ribosome-binding protein